MLKKNLSTEVFFKLFQKKDIESALRKLPVNEVWGIGRRISFFLRQNGVEIAWDFVNLSDAWIKKHINITGLRTKKELLGEECIPLELVPPPKKSIVTSRSFGAMITSLDAMSEAVSVFASRCAFKLRRQQSHCGFVSVFILTNRHRKDLRQYNKSIGINLSVSFNSTIEVVSAALRGLKLIYKEGYQYKKAGVMVTDITTEKAYQAALFDGVDRLKHDHLMKSVDYVNYRVGYDKLKLAACGRGRTWRLKREKITCSYTTRWDEIHAHNSHKNYCSLPMHTYATSLTDSFKSFF